MATIRVGVTQDDIDRGAPRNCGRCPVALALRRATGRTWIVDIDSTRPAHVHYFGRTSPLPDEAAAFVKAFDEGEMVPPTRFDLDVPDEWLSPAGAAEA